jgi:hypothetical protein
MHTYYPVLACRYLVRVCYLLRQAANRTLYLFDAWPWFYHFSVFCCCFCDVVETSQFVLPPKTYYKQHLWCHLFALYPKPSVWALHQTFEEELGFQPCTSAYSCYQHCDFNK